MPQSKADIISDLQKEILSLQGFKTDSNVNSIDVGLGSIKEAFPNASFPLGAIHEFICPGIENRTVTVGFISGILAALMQFGNACIWISSLRTVFPVALASFGIQPDKIIFINIQNAHDIIWVMEESLKCEGIATVIAETKELSFTASRRLQLAVEKSKVTGFILRSGSRNAGITACVTRWRINSLPGEAADDLPGVGFPRWNVELLKVRSGKPGSWQIEWRNGKFNDVIRESPINDMRQRKTG